MIEERVMVRIGIAEGAVISDDGSITTTGLGSCIGLVLFDVAFPIAGMIHIMLPKSPNSTPAFPQKYADTGIAWLVSELGKKGANLNRLRAKYAGGAQMFQSLQMDSLRIGDRNVEAVAERLASLHIPTISTDIGGHLGRTVRFDVATKHYHIRTARGDEREI